MKVENVFEVAEPQAVVWGYLLDVPRVIPCVPGAVLNETVGENEWRADMTVTLGPVTMLFDANIIRDTLDEDAGLVRLVVKAREKNGRGGATAEVESTLSPAGDKTQVGVVTNLKLQGAVARVARSEIVEEVSQQMTDAFANCLQATLSTASNNGDGEQEPPPAPAAPALRITFRSLLAGFFRRLRRRA